MKGQIQTSSIDFASYIELSDHSVGSIVTFQGIVRNMESSKELVNETSLTLGSADIRLPISLPLPVKSVKISILQYRELKEKEVRYWLEGNPPV